MHKFIKWTCITLVLFVVHCNCRTFFRKKPRAPTLEEKIKSFTDKNDKIDGFFKPKGDKQLGTGSYGLVWKGIY